MTTRQVYDAIAAVQTDADDMMRSTNGATPLEEAMRRIWATHPGHVSAAPLDGSHSPGFEWSPPRGSEDVWEHEAVWRQMHSDSAELRKIMDRMFRNVKAWQQHTASAKDRDLAGMNETVEPGCEHCQTVGMWSEIYVKSSDVKGNLAAPMRLCQPCYEYTLRHGQLLTRKQLEDRKAKGTWKESA